MDNLDDSPNWLTCGACGNVGGTGSTPTSTVLAGNSVPSEDGRSTEFSIAATVPFTNTYWYEKHTALHSQFALLTYEFDLFVPTASQNAPQAIEFECQQTLNGWVYNFSWQADYAGNQWRIFNYATKHWESTAVTLTRFTPGTWHHVLAEYHNDNATHTVFHDALTIDGVRFPVNITHAAFFSGDTNDQFTNAFQLDSNSHPDAYNVYVDKMKITYN
jgi:hypothetical protein